MTLSINNVIAYQSLHLLETSRESIPTPHQFSTTHIFRVRIFLQLPRLLSQSEAREDPNLNSGHTHNGKWFQLVV